MRNLGALWERCHNGDLYDSSEWQYQRRITLDGVVYEDDYIVNMSHDKALTYDSFNIGQCMSGRIKVTILPHSDQNMRKGGLIKFQLRVITLNDGESPWADFGYYYIDKAEEERGKWVIEGFDAMKKLDTAFARGDDGGVTWPTSCDYALNKIKNYIGVEIDSRSIINSSIQIGNPEKLTMRDTLGYIGSLHGGNWYMTEENKLRLVIPEISASVANVNKSNSKRIMESGQITFDKVIMRYGDNFEDTFSKGTGDNEIEIYNPWATQVATDRVYNILSNYIYYPCESKSSEINPAVELGDTIELNGRLVNFAQVIYSLRMYANIIIPDEANKQEDIYKIRIDNLENRVENLENGGEVSGCYLLTDADIGITPNIYKGDEKCVIIPKQIWGRDLWGIGSMFNDSGVSKVILSNDYEINSCSSTFDGAKSYSLDLSEFYTRYVKDMKYMFRNCNAFILDLHTFDTSNVENMSDMFSASKAKLINLLSFDTRRVRNMSNMFSYSNAEILDLSSFDTSSVTDMSNMFNGAKVKLIDLNSFNTYSVTNMQGMFSSLSMQSLDLSAINTENVVNMTSMFSGSNITNIFFNNFNTSKVSSMFAMFMSTQTIDLDLTSFDTSNVTTMRRMFYYSGPGESHIRSIDTSSFNTSNVTDMGQMFGGIRIKNIDLSNFTTTNVTSFIHMFSNVYGDYTKSVDISSFEFNENADVYGMFSKDIYSPVSKLTIIVKDNQALSHLMGNDGGESSGIKYHNVHIK